MHAIHHSFANLMQALLEMRDALKLESYTFIELSVYAAMIDIRKKLMMRILPLMRSGPTPCSAQHQSHLCTGQLKPCKARGAVGIQARPAQESTGCPAERGVTTPAAQAGWAGPADNGPPVICYPCDWLPL